MNNKIFLNSEFFIFRENFYDINLNILNQTTFENFSSFKNNFQKKYNIKNDHILFYSLFAFYFPEEFHKQYYKKIISDEINIGINSLVFLFCKKPDLFPYYKLKFTNIMDICFAIRKNPIIFKYLDKKTLSKPAIISNLLSSNYSSTAPQYCLFGPYHKIKNIVNQSIEYFSIRYYPYSFLKFSKENQNNLKNIYQFLKQVYIKEIIQYKYIKNFFSNISANNLYDILKQEKVGLYIEYIIENLSPQQKKHLIHLLKNKIESHEGLSNLFLQNISFGEHIDKKIKFLELNNKICFLEKTQFRKKI